MRGVVIGAGERGAGAYASVLLGDPAAGRIVGVAEPDATRRERFASAHAIPAQARFADPSQLLDGPRLGEFAVIATPDPDHVEPALRAMQRGYHVLLEKPMALTEPDCRALVEASERAGVVLQICHVLRFAPLFESLHRTIANGEIGDVVAIQHSENVSYWHYAHSYARGSWRNAAASAPMILTKACHDLDLLYWLAGSPPARLASFARGTQLTERHAPEGAPEFCAQGCPHAPTCPYDATALYRELTPLLLDLELTRRPRWVRPLVARVRRHRALLERIPLPGLREVLPWKGWPVSVVSADATPAGVQRALLGSRYGRCAYRVGDNDQVSSQAVSIQFESGATASFSMHSASYREGRELRVDGTRGSIVARFYQLEQTLEQFDHKTGSRRETRFPAGLAPHGGGDERLFRSFLAAVRGDAAPVTTAAESFQSHRMAFAADRAQREARVVELSGAQPDAPAPATDAAQR